MTASRDWLRQLAAEQAMLVALGHIGQGSDPTARATSDSSYDAVGSSTHDPCRRWLAYRGGCDSIARAMVLRSIRDGRNRGERAPRGTRA